MKTLKINLSKNLKNLRQRHGMTQVYVAAKLHISYQAYQAYEKGKASPTLPNLIALGNLFNISLDTLIGRKLK